MSINLKPVLPVACFLAWFFFVISCEKPEGQPVDPNMPGDTTIIVPADTIITPTDTIITPPDTVITSVGMPLALFTVDNNYCTAMCKISFTNISVFADTYAWDFGDGSAISTAVSPSHYYTTSGIYRVILTASKSGHPENSRDTQLVEIKRPTGPYAIGTSQKEFGAGLVQTGDGGYVVAGSRDTENGSTDVYLFKTDASRNVIWEKSFGGSGNQVGNAIKPTSDGGYIIVGKTSSVAWGYDYDDVYLVRTDAEGNLLWKKTFFNVKNESGEDVVQTGDGGFLITGISKAEGTFTDLLLIRTDGGGNVIWQKNLGTSSEDAGYAIQQTSDGNFIVGGYYDYGLNVRQPYMIKIDNEGAIIWEQHNAGDLAFVFSVRETSDGGFIGGVDGAEQHWRGVIKKRMRTACGMENKFLNRDIYSTMNARH